MVDVVRIDYVNKINWLFFFLGFIEGGYILRNWLVFYSVCFREVDIWVIIEEKNFFLVNMGLVYRMWYL